MEGVNDQARAGRPPPQDWHQGMRRSQGEDSQPPGSPAAGRAPSPSSLHTVSWEWAHNRAETPGIR